MLEMIIGALIILVGVVVGFGISSVSTEKAREEPYEETYEETRDMITNYNGDVVNNYGDMPQELTYDEGTLFKVRQVLADELEIFGLETSEVDGIIASFQNAGILFRERAK